jgi:hypothetical protein
MKKVNLTNGIKTLMFFGLFTGAVTQSIADDLVIKEGYGTEEFNLTKTRSDFNNLVGSCSGATCVFRPSGASLGGLVYPVFNVDGKLKSLRFRGNAWTSSKGADAESRVSEVLKIYPGSTSKKISFRETRVMAPDSGYEFRRDSIGGGGVRRITVSHVVYPISDTPSIRQLTKDKNIEVEASSENTQTNQYASNIIDGIIDGYPGDYTKEWATYNEREGAYVRISWANDVTITKLRLFDRPNSVENITSATLVFDNQELRIGALYNDGRGTTIVLDKPITTSSVTIRVDSVSDSSVNIGLSEVEISGY